MERSNTPESTEWVAPYRVPPWNIWETQGFSGVGWESCATALKFREDVGDAGGHRESPGVALVLAPALLRAERQGPVGALELRLARRPEDAQA